MWATWCAPPPPPPQQQQEEDQFCLLNIVNNTTFPRTSSADEFPTAVPAVFTIPRPSNLKTFPLFGFVPIYGYSNGENPTNHFPFSKYTISKSKSIFQFQILWLWSIIGFGVYLCMLMHMLKLFYHQGTQKSGSKQSSKLLKVHQQTRTLSIYRMT